MGSAFFFKFPRPGGGIRPGRERWINIWREAGGSAAGSVPWTIGLMVRQNPRRFLRAHRPLKKLGKEFGAPRKTRPSCLARPESLGRLFMVRQTPRRVV